MARRTKAELIAEIDRLYDCMDVIIDVTNEVLPVDMRSVTDKSSLIPRASYHAWVAEKKCTASEAVRGLQEGLSFFSGGLTDLLEKAPDLGNAVLDRYRDVTGRDYWADAGDPRRMVRAILKRGDIRNDAEFRLLNGFLADLDNTTLDDADRREAEAMLAAYEHRARPETA